MRVGSILFSLAIGASVGLSFLISTPGASAETISIVFTEVDLVYDSPALFDATSDVGRNLDTGQSDPLSSAIVTTDAGSTSDTSDVYGDILIQGLTGIPAAGGIPVKSSNGDTFGIDIFSTDGDSWQVQLDLEELTVMYTGAGISIYAFGNASKILPGYDLSPFTTVPIDETKPIQVTLLGAPLNNVQTSGGFLTAFDATGVGTITATLVPEPSTLAGLLMAAAGLLAYAWTRRRR